MNQHLVNSPVHPWYAIRYVLNRCYQCAGTGWLARIAKWIGGIASFVVTGFLLLLQFADPAGQHVPRILRPLAEEFWEHRLAVAIVMLVVLATSSLIVWIVEAFSSNERIDRNKIQAILDRACSHHFGTPLEGHTYRATLFCTRSCLGFGRWLGIVERSGKTYRKLDTIFSIDSDEAHKCTGLVGRCWWNASNNVGAHFYKILPNLREDKRLIPEYMHEGGSTEREVRSIKIPSQFFRLTAIRRRGEVWGVLVLDSTDVTSAPLEGESGESRNEEQVRCVNDAAERITLLIE